MKTIRFPNYRSVPSSSPTEEEEIQFIPDVVGSEGGTGFSAGGPANARSGAMPLTPDREEGARPAAALELTPRETILADCRALKKNLAWLTFYGAAIATLGVVAVALAGLTTIASMAVFGLVLLLAGGLHVAQALARQQRRRFFSEIVMGIFYLAAGALMIGYPLASAQAFAALLAPLFIAGGLIRVFHAVKLRYPGWGWQAVSGGVAMALGGLVWAGWPASSLWITGALVGLEIFALGVSLLAFAWGLKQILEPARAEAEPLRRAA